MTPWGHDSSATALAAAIDANPGSCEQGVCVLGDACPDDGNACTLEWCDEGPGCGVTCGWGAAPPGTACAEEVPPNPCTLDVCDMNGQCTHPAGNNGASCNENDNDPCTVGQCSNGSACRSRATTARSARTRATTAPTIYAPTEPARTRATRSALGVRLVAQLAGATIAPVFPKHVA